MEDRFISQNTIFANKMKLAYNLLSCLKCNSTKLDTQDILSVIDHIQSATHCAKRMLHSQSFKNFTRCPSVMLKGSAHEAACD